MTELFRQRLRRALLVWASMLALCASLAVLGAVLPFDSTGGQSMVFGTMTIVVLLATGLSFVLPAYRFRTSVGRLDLELREHAGSAPLSQRYRQARPPKQMTIMDEAEAVEIVWRAYWASVDLRVALRMVTPAVGFVLLYAGFPLRIGLAFLGVGAALLLAARPSGKQGLRLLERARDHALQIPADGEQGLRFAAGDDKDVEP